MTIGEKIKYLRRKNDLTQEKLAEYLHVSYQAISKWENNTAQPDISFVVPLANFFGITTDELFDFDKDSSKKELAEQEKELTSLWHEGNLRKALVICREVTAKYPNNYKWLLNLAFSLYLVAVGSIDFSEEEQQAAMAEAKPLLARIIEDCGDEKRRAVCRQYLVALYDKSRDTEKALEEAKKAPSMCFSNEILSNLSWSSSDEVIALRENNILILTRFLSDFIRQLGENDSDEIKIKKYEAAIAIWQTVVDDGNFLAYHGDLAHLHMTLTRWYAEKGWREKALECMGKALFHAKKYDEMPKEKTSYTGTFISHAFCEGGKHIKNYAASEHELIKREITSENALKQYESDPEYIRLLET